MFSPPSSRPQTDMAHQYSYNLSPIGQAGAVDRRQSTTSDTSPGPITISIRKLPRNTTPEALRSMLLFAKDLRDTEIVPNDFEEDHAFLTAIARFSSTTGAAEAQALLNGKPNTDGEASMVVELVNGSSGMVNGRRNTNDQPGARGGSHSMSPPLSSLQTAQKSSRFNGTFQSMEKLSPPLVGSPPNAETSSSEASSHLQTIFSPQSLVGTSNVQEYSRITGKSVISQDIPDDDTGELLKDPIAYMKNDSSMAMPNLGRRTTNPQMLASHFSNLSLNTGMTSPPVSNYTSPRSAMPGTTPMSALSPSSSNSINYQMPGPQYLRHNYPPVNPADQNPPCNTLYVGNLPIDTSEDELKAMFSKQRGYKRLCFRTKQNGPMCFVEFEDVSFATKALNELYGVQLHNSVKGGIRLSFSKNPLGVRAGQPGSANPSTPMSANGHMNGIKGLSAMSPGGFSTANGPPPGLSVPPGLGMSMVPPPTVSNPMTPSMMNGGFSNHGLGIGSQGMHNFRGTPLGTTSGGPSLNGYPDYMMGR